MKTCITSNDSESVAISPREIFSFRGIQKNNGRISVGEFATDNHQQKKNGLMENDCNHQ